MAIGVRSFDGKYSCKWANATRGVPGIGVKLSAEETGDVATAQTDVPLGILMNDPAQNDHANVQLAASGGIVRAIAGAAIALNALVCVNGSGKFVTVVQSATQDATTEFAWGRCVKAALAADDYFELQLLPLMGSLT